MKKLLVAVVAAISLLTLCSCGFGASSEYRHLPEFKMNVFEESTGMEGIVFQGKNYYRLGPMPSTSGVREQTMIARYQDKGRTLLVGELGGYDHILLVEHLEQDATDNKIRTVEYVYIREDAEEIPIELLNADPAQFADGQSFEFSGNRFAYYASLPQSFQPGEKLGEAQDRGSLVELYSIPDRPANQWICGREPGDNGAYRLYQSDAVQSVPFSYYQNAQTACQ